MSSGLLQSILARLDRLEQLYSSQATEQLQPSYLTIDPETGAVSAKFSGVVQADGVTLPANDGSEPITRSTVAWDDTSGNVLASVQGFTTPELLLRALSADGSSDAAISLQGANGNSQITIDANNGNTLTLLNDLGQSSFLQLPTPEGLTVVFGFYDYPGGWPGGFNPVSFGIPISGLASIGFGCVNLSVNLSGTYVPVAVASDYTNPSEPVVQVYNIPGTPGAGTPIAFEYGFFGAPS